MKMLMTIKQKMIPKMINSLKRILIQTKKMAKTSRMRLKK